MQEMLTIVYNRPQWRALSTDVSVQLVFPILPPDDQYSRTSVAGRLLVSAKGRMNEMDCRDVNDDIV